MYDNSLVLAMNFDDVGAVGDTAAKVVDVSKYGNNGTIYGNTVLLMHMDEGDNKTAFDESRYGNNGTIYGNTVGLWRFDENTGSTTADATAYARTGTIYGATWAAGKNGSGLNFDGINDYVDYGNFLSVGKTTVTMWFKSSDLKANNGLISFRSGGMRGLFTFNHSNSQPILYLANSNYKYFSTTANNYLDGNWHFLVLYIAGASPTDIENATLSIDLNNIASGSVDKEEAPDEWTGLIIGQISYGNYNGSIDEVAIYNRSLSASEVSAIYNAGKAKFVEWTTGKSGTGLQFDGIDDYVDCGNTTSLKNIRSAVTVEAWAKYNSYNGGAQAYSVIAVKGPPWTFLMENPNNKIRFRVSVGGVDVNANDSVAHELNRWYHFVGTYDGANIRIYKDGVQVGITPQTGTLDMNDNTAKIGTYTGTTYNFNGTIDEVGIYNRSLSAAEVLAHYNAGKAKHADWDASGKWGSAMKFDGINDYVNGTIASNMSGSSAASLVAWFKTDTQQANTYIVSIPWNSAGNNGLDLLTYNGFIQSVIRNSSSYVVTNSLPVNYYDGRWHQAASVFNGTHACTYFDAATPVCGSLTGTLQVSSSSEYDMGRLGTWGGYFNGSIDEVRIWNRSLSASEIQQQYYSNLAKYDASKWLFTATMPSVPAGNHNYYITASESQFGNVYNQSRAVTLT
jgi:hypothetical protein